MMQPNDSLNPPHTDPHSLPRMRWWKPSLWLPVLIGFGVLQLIALVLGIGYYIYIVLPENTFARIDDAPWRVYNVGDLSFKSPSDFANARRILMLGTQKDENRSDPAPTYLLAELDNTLANSTMATQLYQQVLVMARKNWYTGFAYRNFSINAHAALAVIYYERGKLSQAKSELDAIPDFSETEHPNLLQALRDRIENPDRADFHLLLGKELRHHLKLALASREILEAERLSSSPELRREAVNFMKTQMPRTLKELSPMTRYYSQAGESCGDPAAAVAFYEKAVRETPNYEWGYNELAIFYRQLKRYDTAVDRANRAIAINPDFYNPYLTLGDIAIDQENYPAAIHYFETAQQIIQRLPSDDSQTLTANIENQLGYASELMAQVDAAAHHYQLAMLAASDNEDASSEADYDYAQDGLARMEAERKKAATRTEESLPQLSWGRASR